MNNTDAFRFLQQEVTRLRDENRELREELTLLRSSIRALSALQDILQRLTPGGGPRGLGPRVTHQDESARCSGTRFATLHAGMYAARPRRAVTGRANANRTRTRRSHVG